MSEGSETRGLTIRELMLEMRTDIRKLFNLVDHLENNAVTRDELQMWREAQRATRRWAITTIISLIIVGVMILGIMLNQIPSPGS